MNTAAYSHARRLLTALSAATLMVGGIVTTPQAAFARADVPPTTGQTAPQGDAFLLSPPQVVITRTDNAGNTPKVGDRLTYTVKVTNPNGASATFFPRSSTLSNAAFEEDSRPSCRHINLAGTKSDTCTVHHVVNEDDLKQGNFTPSITAFFSKDNEGRVPLSAEFTATEKPVTVQANPNLKPLTVSITRTDRHLPDERARVGQRLTFSVTVTNPNTHAVDVIPGKANLDGFTYTGVGDSCRYLNLGPGQSFTCNFPFHFASLEDGTARSFTPNVEFAIGADQEGRGSLLTKAYTGPQIPIYTPNNAQEAVRVTPFTFEWKRTDKHGKEARLGDLLTWTVRITNKTGLAVQAQPTFANTNGTLPDQAMNCRYFNLAADESYECTSVQHRVTEKDLKAGSFTPFLVVDANEQHDTLPNLLHSPPSYGEPVKVVDTPRSNDDTRPDSTPDMRPPAPPVQPAPPSGAPAPQPPAPAPRPVPPVAPPVAPAPAPQSPTPQGTPRPQTQGPRSVVRIAGETRFETAINVSRASFRDGQAKTVIIARADVAADSVSAVPLAKALNAPVLLTPHDQLHPGVLAELKRVMAPGAKVIVMGGEAAISTKVQSAITQLGATVERVAGPNRAATAVATANRLGALGKAKEVLLVDGTDWQADLIAGPAAAKAEGVIMLTNGAQMAPETAAYLGRNARVKVTGIGANGAAQGQASTKLTGADATALSLAVAKHYFSTPTALGLATTVDFADALAGGAHIAQADGPLVLVGSTTPPAVLDWVKGQPIRSVTVYGGVTRISDRQLEAFTQ